MKRILLGVILMISITSLFAQSIKGRVTDEFGLPLPGATIKVLEKEYVGGISDGNGNYTINVEAGDYTLEVSYLGYIKITQPVTVSGNTKVDFDMEPGATEGAEVIVLGDRLKGQAKAINQQRTNDNITNVIAADQIGRFPDANMGDALKRVPGITMQGDQGEARNIIIRGLAPQLNSVTLNGNRLPSAEGDNRNIQMDLIPADMIQTVQVNKAITPAMDADAIGGSVNLVTRTPPTGLRVSGNLGTSRAVVGEGLGYNGGIVVGKGFGKLGVIFSGSYRNDMIGSDNIEAEWSNEVENAADGEDYEVAPYVAETDIREYQIERTRRSASLDFNYEINTSHSLFVKSMYTWRDDWENRFRLRTSVENADFANGTNSAPTAYYGEASRQTKGGVGSDRVDNRRLEDQRVRMLSIGGQHDFGALDMSWMGSIAKASEERPDERYIVYETDFAGGPLNVDVSDPEFPLITPTNAADGADNNYAFDKIEREFQFTEEKDQVFQIDFKLPVKFQDGGFLKFGAKYRGKKKFRDNNFTEYGWVDDTNVATLSQVPTINQTDADYLAGSQFQAGNFVSPQYLGGLDLDNSALFEGESQPSEFLAANYTAEENIIAGYAQVDQNFGDLKVLAGVRIERTSFDYVGNEVVDEETLVQEITGSDDYTNILPSLHFKYDFTDDIIVRAAWTNSLARPNYFDLVPYVDNRTEDLELFLGNPNLDPTTSSNIDLMGEMYFQSVGLFSIGGFYKSIDNFIYIGSSEQVIDGENYDVFQAQNSGEGSITGFEVSVQRQLDFLPGIWKGIGVYLNYTNLSSDVTGIANEDGDTRDDIDLPGTANNMFNGSLSFESKKLVIRASINYSSDYIDEVGGNSFEDRYYDEQFFLDINASYAVTSKWRVFGEANNLTNQPLRYYQGQQNRTMQSEFYGPKYNFGVKFDMFNK
ncbi:TonB-dependent receptor [Ekhidna sp.]